MSLNFDSTLPGTKAHFLLDIYEGDIEWVMEGGVLVRKNKLLESIGGWNTIVANGKQLNAQRLFAAGGPPGAINSMGVGTDSTASNSSQTQLNPSVAGSVLLQAFDSTPTVSAGVATCVSTFGTGVANFAWAELGMFNGTTNGTSVMLDRIAPIGPFTKSSAVSIVVTVTYTQG